MMYILMIAVMLYSYLCYSALENRLLSCNLVKERKVSVGVSIYIGLIMYIIGPSLESIIYVVYMFILVNISIEDIYFKTISNSHIIVLFISNVIFIILMGDMPIIFYVIGLLFPSILLLFLSIFTGYKIGMGDVKLIAMMGMGLGASNTMEILALSCILGGIASVVLLVFKVLRIKDTLPFAPCIMMGYFIFLLS